MPARLSRRGVLRAAGAFAVIEMLGVPGARAAARRAERAGPLVPDPAGRLDLPEGFAYTAFGRAGDPMTDGTPTPSAHDGMGAFAGPDGATVLVRNHELTAAASGASGVQVPLARRYDPGQGAVVRGGTTTLVVGRDGRLAGAWATLGGTLRNCSGGVTPWGTWISCEETTETPETDRRLTRRHGYCFEVPATARSPVDPVPLVALGRFAHEAVAVDPRTGIVYETEDRPRSCFYRFLPDTPGALVRGGRLQAMRLADFPGGVDTGRDLSRGVRLDVEWVTVPLPDPGARDTPVAAQALGLGAASIARGEGIVWNPADASFYLSATSGGAAGAGQIFRYVPRAGRDGHGLFELFAEAAPDTETGPSEWEWPDNLTVTPWGDLIACEDGPGTQYLTLITRDGAAARLARNAASGFEFSGACFSADARVLFVNVQGSLAVPGVTYAITGPWRRRLGPREGGQPQPPSAKRGSAAGTGASGSFSSRRTRLAPSVMATVL
jgi:secreted PhoX family phosphatase